LTLLGPLIVHDPHDPYRGQYDEELVLTMSDWYHTSVPTLISQMLVPENVHALPPFPDALLLNDGQNVKFNFVPGKTYKIRMVNMGAFASTMIQFDSHTMQVIEIDGSYVEKHQAYQLRISPAERYTVLLKAQPTTRRNYAFLAALDMNRDFANDAAPVWPFNITGTLVYDASKAAPSPYVVPKWSPLDDATLHALDCQRILGRRDYVDQDIRLDFNFGFDSHGIPR
jgi:iron transport multicopper oxidase